ncbi:SIR2 family protein [uncultured Granulicatella sp.]|uniref:SIR2 family protein n=1 Tax=uncultured Granulicatella sp. TaxID=316089 RepID=UPI0037DC0A4E
MSDFNIEQFKRNVLTKNLNILIGSGVSYPAIPLMNFFSKDDKGMPVSKEVANTNLENHIWKVSSFLPFNHNDRIKYFVENIDRQTLYSTDYFTELNKFIAFEDNIDFVLERYIKFLEKIIALLYTSNSRTVSKNVNIFTTNYDLFIERSLDLLMKNDNLIFNDGANGYFYKVLDSSNYNKSVAYRGLNENYLNELPSISLIKPHGSMNWEKGENNQILIRTCTVNHPVVVRPTGLEGQETYLNNHFHDMLRVFQLELDKPQSVLIVIGFSFQDDHIAKMIRRALKNPELMIYIFCYADSDFDVIKKNLSLDNIPRNLQIVIPSDLEVENKNTLSTSGNFDISSLTKLFIIED